jgi:hypothetical protein
MIQGGFPEQIFPEQIWRSWPQRVVFLLLAFFVLATIVPRRPPPPPPRPEMGTLRYVPIPLDAGDPRRRRIGALRFLGGWELTSDSARFGGISGLHVEGGEAFAISDAGILFRFALPRGGGMAPMRIVPLMSGPGPATKKSNRDTESMVMDGQWLWASFERHNMVWRYRRSDLRATASAQPAPMRRWRVNAGAEAMTRLADGRFLVFGEGIDVRPDSDAVLFDGDPAEPATRAMPLRYRRVPGYRVTDAALLPDGRLLLLNRRFAWLEGFSAVLTVADTRGLRAGATIAGREVAVLRPPASVDNMEALSVTRENGRTIVWIASDDNFIPLQRTLLLKFEWVE